jgi:hypothetical protein
VSSPAGLLLHIERAEQHVGAARQSWNRPIGKPCAACLQHLQEALSELQQAQAEVVRGVPPPETKGRLERLRRDLTSLGKLVDAAGAFYRGLPGYAEAVETAPAVTEA